MQIRVPYVFPSRSVSYCNRIPEITYKEFILAQGSGGSILDSSALSF